MTDLLLTNRDLHATPDVLRQVFAAGAWPSGCAGYAAQARVRRPSTAPPSGSAFNLGLRLRKASHPHGLVTLMPTELTPLDFLDEAPADEYDRQLARRKTGAKRTIRRCFWFWLLGHAFAVTAVVLLIVSVVNAANDAEGVAFFTMIGAAASAIVAPLLWTVPAGRAAFVAVRDRSVLSWPWIVYGLAPWMGLCTELSAFTGLMILVRLV
jgi:hypothetical protein